MSRRKYRKNTNQATASAPVMTQDSFQNMMARLGVGMPNMMNGTDYPLTRLTQNYNLLNSLYRNHWIVRKIVDTIPEDMCKNWIKFITQEPPEEMKKLDKVIKNTKTKERILEGLKWGRLYGGAAGVILLNRQEDMLAEPLNYDLILPGDYKGILILDRWSGISPDLELVSDLTSPDFGLPSSYRVTLQTGEALTVHHSRIIRFTGDALPAWEAWTELQWGASVIESVFDELKKRDNTSYNIANLVFLANLRVYKTNLVDLLGLGTEQMQRDFYNAMEILNWMMNNSGMSVIGKDDGFETHQYTFAGINDIYESFMLDVSGACGIPVTRLFGRSPAGFNATGESDLTNYYDAIETKQESQLAPILDKLIPIIALSTWGRIPEDIDYDFNPLRRANPKENADLSKSFGDNVVDVYNAGLISQRTALKELRQQAEVTGMWSNITDEDIEKASDQLDSLGGDMPGLEGLLNPGGNSGGGNLTEGENRGPFKVTADANNRLPFGLCKKEGIELPEDATPEDAWEALKKKTGKSPDDFYKEKTEKEGTSGEKSGIIKPLDIDDFMILASGRGIADEVSDVIINTIVSFEKRDKDEDENLKPVFFSDVEFGEYYDSETGKPALFQTDLNRNGMVILKINEKKLQGRTLQEIDQNIANTPTNLPQSLEEAVIHECGHARAYYRKTAAEIVKMNQELKNKGVPGISFIAEKDGAECIAEVEVLLYRNETVPKAALELYRQYTEGRI